ncbi:ABC transporter permease [Streptomyces sp. NPDC056254]|uniref:ABC transporter permease n=1 Tax=Streptomyces sp. NPDC056254 TaxID=3345763 RepID=UPI0035D90CF4
MAFTIAVKSSVANKGRMALSLVAITLSVAFVAGTLIFTDTANSTFDRLFKATAADITVSAGHDATPAQRQNGARPKILPERIVRQIAASPGVVTAQGEVSVQDVAVVNPATKKSIGPTDGAPSIAGNWYIRPNSALEITEGQAPRGPGQALLDADTAHRAHLKAGAPVRIISTTGTYDVTISGIVTFTSTNPGVALILFDTPTAQRYLLGQTGVYTSVVAFGDGTRNDEQLKSQISGEIGNSHQVRTAAETIAQNKTGFGDYLRFLKYAMLGFAGISLLVGGFLIINTYLMLVGQRTREIGLLRAIGIGRAKIYHSLIAEALITGLIGSALGVAAGYFLAMGLIQLLGALGMRFESTHLTLRWTAPLTATALGAATTLTAAWLPARRASAISPLEALREHQAASITGASNQPRTGLGLIIGVIGTALLTASTEAPDLHTGGVLLGLGIPLTLTATVILGPLLATAAIRVGGTILPLLFGVPGRLSQRNALRNPQRTGTTAAALMTCLALVTSTSVIASSMVRSATSQIEQAVGADYLITSRSGTITPEILRAIRAIPELGNISEERQLSASISTTRGKIINRHIYAVTPNYRQNINMQTQAGDFNGAIADGISLDADFVKAHQLKVGDILQVALEGGKPQPIRLRAVTAESNAIFKGRGFIGLATARQWVPENRMPFASQVLAAAADPSRSTQTYSTLQASLVDFPHIRVLNQLDYKTLIKGQVDQLIQLIYGLLGLSILVGALGVMNTLTLSVIERTREIGLLRAVGLQRHQILLLIQVESLIITLIGAVLGGGLGIIWGVAGQRALRAEGLRQLAIPADLLTELLASAVLIGVVAAITPAFRASRINLLTAINGRP